MSTKNNPKKMKFKTSIEILGRKFKVKQLKNLGYQGQPCLGLCDNNTKVIYLEKEQPDEHKKETMIHEAVHAMLCISGMDQKLSESENEMYAQLFTALYVDIEKYLK